jgi:hypothetical protein
VARQSLILMTILPRALPLAMVARPSAASSSRQHRADVDGERARGGLLGERGGDLADRSGHDGAAGQASGRACWSAAGVVADTLPPLRTAAGGEASGENAAQLDEGVDAVRVVGGAGGHHGRAAGGEQLHGVRSDAAGSALDQDDLAGLRVDGAVRSLVLDPSPRRK